MSAGETYCPEPYASRENSNIQEVATGIQRWGRGETVEPHHWGDIRIDWKTKVNHANKLQGTQNSQSKWEAHRFEHCNFWLGVYSYKGGNAWEYKSSLLCVFDVEDKSWLTFPHLRNSGLSFVVGCEDELVKYHHCLHLCVEVKRGLFFISLDWVRMAFLVGWRWRSWDWRISGGFLMVMGSHCV
ncbi:hypothetical protein IHE45_10G011000 [Dioscorea alata]|uniref:Uncharacterized protein n=1 Tax=Dioscorea alata TaxID=55571 RepID=A0ACB7V9J1_DIOAL|nr:hypothetical protein IHE45_10G011000 [Dioscorea alata]